MAKQLKTSPQDRRCQFPDCNRLLSIYNHQIYCRFHLDYMASKEKAKPYRHVCK